MTTTTLLSSSQLLGVAIRADMPVALDLLPCFWKCLRGEGLTLTDLREADCITYNLTQKMLEVRALGRGEKRVERGVLGRGEWRGGCWGGGRREWRGKQGSRAVANLVPRCSNHVVWERG